MPIPSILSALFSRAILSHVESADNKAREEKKQRSKKDTTSTNIISQHKAASSCGSRESTGPPQSSSTSSTSPSTQAQQQQQQQPFCGYQGGMLRFHSRFRTYKSRYKDNRMMRRILSTRIPN
jgi:hypothetical protein